MTHSKRDREIDREKRETERAFTRVVLEGPGEAVGRAAGSSSRGMLASPKGEGAEGELEMERQLDTGWSPTLRSQKVGFFCSLVGPVCLYIRPHNLIQDGYQRPEAKRD